MNYLVKTCYRVLTDYFGKLPIKKTVQIDYDIGGLGMPSSVPPLRRGKSIF